MHHKHEKYNTEIATESRNEALISILSKNHTGPR